MKDGVCPECGSDDIRTDSPKRYFRGTASYIMVGAIAGSTKLSTYVCVSCGCVRNYIADDEKLRQIAEQWPRVEIGPHTEER